MNQSENRRQLPIQFPVPSVPLEDASVKMSNALIRGAHGINNIIEKRIVNMALSKTPKDSSSRFSLSVQEKGWEVCLYADEYARLHKLSPNTAYEQLKSGADSLMDRKWCISRRHAQTKRHVTQKGPWFILAEYCEGEGYVKLVFSPYVASHVLSLSKYFTSYRLIQTAQLKSIYALRLFEALESWRFPSYIWNPTLEEFFEVMDAPQSAKKDFGNTRKGIIEPAIKELTEKLDWEIHYVPQKKGRKVVGLVFNFKDNTPIAKEEEEIKAPEEILLE